jgi:hypothetical protein
MTELGDILLRMAIDVAAIAVLAGGLFHRRHRRMDLVVVYSMFNVGLFLALVVISGGEVSMGVGFGLFAVLSIVRLRSEPFSNRELAYFFVALVIALVCAIDLGSPAYAGVLAGLALLAAWVIDHPRLSQAGQRLEVTLELVFADHDGLRRHLEERLHADVTELKVLEIDYVRETTRAEVRYVPRPRGNPVHEEAFDAAIAGRDR